MKIINAIITLFIIIKLAVTKFFRRRFISKANRHMEKLFKEQFKQRVELRQDINNFWREYFGLDARSKFIPKKFRNSEEVKAATMEKFSNRMERLNVQYDHLFK